MSEPIGGAKARLLMEFFVVIAGVLAALAAESWWSNREAHAYELDLREDMLEEFRVNLSILDADLAENAVVLAGVRATVEMEQGTIHGLSNREVHTRFDSLLGSSYAGFDPAMGVARALVQSGDLATISDRALRLQLAEWAARLDEKQRFTLNSTDFFLNHLSPRIAAMGSDGTWTASERSEVQALLRVHLNLVETLVVNQVKLREVAEGVVSHLASDEGM